MNQNPAISMTSMICKASFVTALLFAAMACKVYAVMPDHFYEDMIRSSSIQATAVITERKEISKTRWSRTWLLTFQLTRNYGEFQAADTFTGQLLTSLPGASPPPGGDLYFPLPALNKEVFVTLHSPGGRITSLTNLNEDLQCALDNQPQAVVPLATSVKVDENYIQERALKKLAEMNREELDIYDDSIFVSPERLTAMDINQLRKALENLRDSLAQTADSGLLSPELHDELGLKVQQALDAL